MGSWSGLRKQIKSRIVPELQDRIDLHYTVYEARGGAASSPPARFWITLDGKEVYSVSGPARNGNISQKSDLPDQELLDTVVAAVRDYLSLNIADARSSSVPVVRALAVIDSRTGLRSLKKLETSSDNDPLVTVFLGLRKTISSRQ